MGKRTRYRGCQHNETEEGIAGKKRENNRAKNGSLRNTSKAAAYMILKNHASAPFRKERLSVLNKASREASRTKLGEESAKPNKVKT